MPLLTTLLPASRMYSAGVLAIALPSIAPPWISTVDSVPAMLMYDWPGVSGLAGVTLLFAMKSLMRLGVFRFAPSRPIPVGATMCALGPTMMPLALDTNSDGGIPVTRPSSGSPVGDEINFPKIADSKPLVSMLRTAASVTPGPDVKVSVASPPTLKPAELRVSNEPPNGPQRITPRTYGVGL